MNDENSIVIIGSGLAGYTLAKEFRKLDTQSPLFIITADDGRFYSKPLLSTAIAQQKQAADIAIADAITMTKQLNATIHTHTQVEKIDPQQQIIYTTKHSIKYAKLIFAVGADNIKSPIIGNASETITAVNDLETYTRFRELIQDKKHITILGAGLVGCEFANDLSQHGKHNIDVITTAAYPLANLIPEAIGLWLQNSMPKNVQWHFGQTILSVDHAATGLSVQLSSGNKLIADVVLSAIGLRPRVDLAKQTKIVVRKGIVVNEFLQTNYPNIFALGDCAEVNGLVQLFVAPLLHCARTLAKTLAGELTAVHFSHMPVVIKTPACPIVVLPPPRDIAGTWKLTGENSNLSALFYDEHHQLRGFALTGSAVKEKNSLLQLMAST